MIELFVALSLGASAVDTPSRDELSQCLAYLARAPEYASLSDDDLARHHGFLESAEGYCSDESSPFWKSAHQKARAKLGAPADGRPIDGQQKLAKQEMHFILGQAWKEASKYRAKPNRFPKDKMAMFAMAWLLDDRNWEEIQSLIEKPMLCFRAAFRKNGGVKPEEIRVGMANPNFRKIGTRCGYETTQDALANRVNARFPDMGAEFAKSSTNSFLGEMTFWAVLSE